MCDKHPQIGSIKICPACTLLDNLERSKAAFTAGWNAQRRVHTHDWGPPPPDTAEEAFAQFEKGYRQVYPKKRT